MLSWYTIKPRLIIVHVFTENVSLNNRLGSFILDVSLNHKLNKFYTFNNILFFASYGINISRIEASCLRQLISSSSFEKHDGMVVVFEL